eukprot:scaffold39826_cov57-Phaeocystis_antarctica.AAC.1
MGVAHVRCWWHRQRRGQERQARWRQHLASLCPGSAERPDSPQPARPQPHAHRDHTERDWPAVSAGGLGAGRLQPTRRLAEAVGLAHVAPHPRPCTHRRGRHAADAACAADAADAAAPQRDARERLLALAARQPQHAHPHRARCAAHQTRSQPHVPMLQPMHPGCNPIHPDYNPTCPGASRLSGVLPTELTHTLTKLRGSCDMGQNLFEIGNIFDNPRQAAVPATAWPTAYHNPPYCPGELCLASRCSLASPSAPPLSPRPVPP